MPRGLANLYDFGVRIPLIISMPERFAGGRVVDDFVNLADFAPTILELAEAPPLENMTAKSLVGILESTESGIVDAERDFIVTARERHAFVRKGGPGYPARALRTREFLYIRNYRPELWPAGDPPLFGDVDAHMLHYPSLTKMYMLKHRDEPGVKELFELGFGKRPGEELYDLEKDPDQMNNVAGDPAYQEAKGRMAVHLTEYLKRTGDPRETGGEMKWIDGEYFATQDKMPQPSEDSIEQLGLEAEYSYID
jgi:arylsulfatase A-like enzyme